MNKKLILLFISAFVLLASMSIVSFAGEYTEYDSYKTGKITINNLNVRSEADKTGSVIGKVQKNDKVTLEGYVNDGDNNWYKITYSGKEGYISGKYVKEVSSVGYKIYTPVKYGKVTPKSGVNLRSKASTDAKIKKVLYKGEIKGIKGEVTKNGKKWYVISYKNKKAYVAAKYIKLIPRTTYIKKYTSYVKLENKKYGKVISESSLTVRDKASKSGEEIGAFEKGTKIKIYGYKRDINGNKWYKTKCGSEYGYVFSDYIKKISKTSYYKKAAAVTEEHSSDTQSTESTETESTSSTTSTGGSSSVADYALSFSGVPYVWGGASPSGFDCSGFVMYVYSQFGVSLPHSSWDIENYGVGVSYDEARAGDIICYGEHVAIYLGGGSMVHASSSAGCVTTGTATYRSIRTIRRVL